MRPSRALPPLLYALPLLFLAGFFFYPLIRIFGVSFWVEGRLALGGIGETVTQPLLLAGALVHHLAGRSLHWADPDPGPALGLRLRPLRLPRQGPAAGADHHPLRHAHGGGGRGLHRLGGGERPAQRLAASQPGTGRTAHPPHEHRLDHPVCPRLSTTSPWSLRTVGSFWANLDPRLEEAAAVLGAGPRPPSFGR